MTSSDSESEEDEEEMMDDLDTLVEAATGQRSLRRSSRVPGANSTNGKLHRFKGTNATDRNNNLNGNGTPKRRSLLKPEHFFSFLDTTFWQKYAWIIFV